MKIPARDALVRNARGFVQASVEVVGCVPSHRLRLLAYRNLFGVSIGPGSTVYRSVRMRDPWQVEIGHNTIIGDGAVLDGRSGLRIGNNVNLSSAVWIWTMDHDKDSPDFAAKGLPVVIEDRVWLSCRTTVLPGVTVGEGAVVCAGAVVSRDVDPFTVVGGVPARKIGERRTDLSYSLDYRVPFL